MIVARFWIGNVKAVLRMVNNGVNANALYFRYGQSENDWYSGFH
jgi:hypothetical protein